MKTKQRRQPPKAPKRQSKRTAQRSREPVQRKRKDGWGKLVLESLVL